MTWRIWQKQWFRPWKKEVMPAALHPGNMPWFWSIVFFPLWWKIKGWHDSCQTTRCDGSGPKRIQKMCFFSGQTSTCSRVGQEWRPGARRIIFWLDLLEIEILSSWSYLGKGVGTVLPQVFQENFWRYSPVIIPSGQVITNELIYFTSSRSLCLTDLHLQLFCKMRTLSRCSTAIQRSLKLLAGSSALYSTSCTPKQGRKR